MSERDLALLEYVAIRNETKVDYKVWEELNNIGAIGFHDFPDIADLKRISEEYYTRLSGRTSLLIDDAVGSSPKVKEAALRYAEFADRGNIRIIPRDSDLYPRIWRYLSGMPPVLFLKGDPDVLREVDNNGGAAIVGSRDPGRYALYATREFSQALSDRNVVIVSGMALGIDRNAHEACMANNGRTIAVLPGGCDVIYPYHNRDTYERICQTGAVVSEMPPGQDVIKQYFPSRNRLISALSDVCLIMEAGKRSGTLHTASFAANQGKDVFVLPNSIYVDNCIGGLDLLRDGAEVLIDVETVYERIQKEVENRRLLCGDYPEEPDLDFFREMMKVDPEHLSEGAWKAVICDEISEKPRNIDELCNCLGIPFTYLSSIITMLETEGLIANERGKYVLTIQKGSSIVKH